MATSDTTTARRATRTRVWWAVILLVGGLLLSSDPALAAPPPNKFLLTSYFGQDVDRTKRSDICTVASKDECQQGERSSEAGGLFFPTGIAVDNDPSSSSYEHIYVADEANRRVDEFTAAGQFFRMFGKGVNKLGGNLCTAAEEGNCQAGTEGGAPGEFGRYIPSVAVDPATGDVYVADVVLGEAGGESAQARRVQVFSSSGVFLRAIGKGVNNTTSGNVCAGAECGPAILQTEEQAANETAAGAFDFAPEEAGNMLAVGGPSDALYVGDRGRVQRFSSTTGISEGEISLVALSASGVATGVGVDQAGDLFVADTEASGVHEYSPADVLEPVVIDPNSSRIRGVAVDPNGRVGVIDAGGGQHATLYTATGREISEFSPAFGADTITPETPGEPKGLAFSSSGSSFVINTNRQYIEAYTSVLFPEVATCAAGEVTGTTAKLCAEIDPQTVHTRGLFRYGRAQSFETLSPTAFEGEGETFETVAAAATKLVPHQEYQYQALVEAQANGEPLQAHGETMTFQTSIVPPQIPGTPSAPFHTSQSAVVTASLNPEHTTTRYRFEYGACPSLAGCASVASTAEESSSLFGEIGASAELTGLTPSTTYSYRLVAINENNESATGAQGTFTTASTPLPTVETGGYAPPAPTGALISGTVYPNGVPTSYAFEVGVYEGAATQYGIVLTGSAGAGTAAVPASYLLTGLQPGTTYAYRLTISSGYIPGTHTLQGATVLFTTPGLPSVISLPLVPAQLPIPAIGFPESPKGKPSTVTNAQKLTNALKACHRQHNRKLRASCERKARKAYPLKGKKK
ncbi:MAG TPA: hypothetical protein VHU62_17790 [Mycobacterium sp.]|jgi:hypothetical protein|nr:hypothetical protein [Mycobacterium sp.]